MTVKTFGSHKEPATQAEVRDYASELQDLVGAKFPVSVSVNSAGNLIGASYESSWKEGGTTPVELTDPETNDVTIEYREDYKDKKLSASQVKQIDGWLKENIAE